MNGQEWAVGQDVVVERRGNNARRSTEPTQPGRVVKVGRRYVYVAITRLDEDPMERAKDRDHGLLSFEKDGAEKSDGYASSWHLWATQEAYARAAARAEMERRVNRLPWGWVRHMSDDTLRAILADHEKATR